MNRRDKLLTLFDEIGDLYYQLQEDGDPEDRMNLLNAQHLEVSELISEEVTHERHG